MGEHHREHCDPPRVRGHLERLRRSTVSSRSRLAPAGACPSPTTPSPVVLVEALTGAPSPFAPPRGSWRTPAATPVKRRVSHATPRKANA